MFAPSGLAISQNDRKLYWVDKESYIHVVRRTSLDEGDVEEFVSIFTVLWRECVLEAHILLCNSGIRASV